MQKSNREQLLEQRRKSDAEEYGGKPDPEFFGADWTAHDAHLAGSATLAPIVLMLAGAMEKLVHSPAYGPQSGSVAQVIYPAREALAQLDAFLGG